VLLVKKEAVQAHYQEAHKTSKVDLTPFGVGANDIKKYHGKWIHQGGGWILLTYQ
jgi:hypothetical protein